MVGPSSKRPIWLVFLSIGRVKGVSTTDLGGCHELRSPALSSEYTIKSATSWPNETRASMMASAKPFALYKGMCYHQGWNTNWLPTTLLRPVPSTKACATTRAGMHSTQTGSQLQPPGAIQPMTASHPPQPGCRIDRTCRWPHDMKCAKL
jgi:hypothetical protein